MEVCSVSDSDLMVWDHYLSYECMASKAKKKYSCTAYIIIKNTSSNFVDFEVIIKIKFFIRVDDAQDMD